VTEDGESIAMRLQDAGQCVVGLNGDNLVFPFQCDLCHFRNIKKRALFASDLQDLNLRRGIRRANLDALGKDTGYCQEQTVIDAEDSETSRGSPNNTRMT
jgi:hypothetical protein